ncbi:MAG: hypothetical protein IJJ41_09015 [Clostridia bacterium]|nr:hypothetical protein [Clostridia bacterium]
MDTLNIYACGGDTVIIVGGIGEDQIESGSAEIIKNAPLSVQAGFVRSTEIQIPRSECAAELFSADCSLCFGKYLHALSGEKEELSLSASGLQVPFRWQQKEDNTCSLVLAGRAKSDLSGAVPCVSFGNCAYFFSETEPAESAQEMLQQLSQTRSERCCALLSINEAHITPYFVQKCGATAGFSAGSAAIALAFFESETKRDFFQKTYRFPKGERQVEIKRFLSEAFDCTLTAKVEEK